MDRWVELTSELNRSARLTAKRTRPEMAPQRLEKIESAPGNGMGSEASNPQDVVHGRAADRARLRLTSRRNHKVAELRNSQAGGSPTYCGGDGDGSNRLSMEPGAACCRRDRRRCEVIGAHVRRPRSSAGCATLATPFPGRFGVHGGARLHCGRVPSCQTLRPARRGGVRALRRRGPRACQTARDCMSCSGVAVRTCRML
jgi:hypothetical protein